MPSFRTILFAGDFSEGSKDAFRVACSLAREGTARLIVLHALEATHIVEESACQGHVPPATSPYDRGNGGYHGAVKERLRRAYAPDRPIEMEYAVRDGSPAEEILRTADEAGCDLIVLGTHGRTGLARLLAGSVAESVLRRARCPVLALHATAGVPAGGRDEVILHPTDFSDRSRSALRTARAIAKDRGARLVLLHVIPVQIVIYGTIPAPPELRAVCDELAAMARKVDGPDLKHPVATRLAQGDAATEIAAEAEEEPGCSLIVMGTHGRGGPARLLMGSVAESVLRRSGFPVLAVKASPVEAARAIAERPPGVMVV